jgi:D-glycero-D-manno-heptose 1,7-bisphosphate phosphatase
VIPSESKAIFLDRDGVLIRERGDYTWLLEDMKIIDGVVEALQMFQRAGYLLIVISNQSGIGKELYTKNDADYLHMHLERFFANNNITINEFYYCPHHPTSSNCICRKPDSQLLEKAIARFNVNPLHSWFIGDADRDIVAGVKAGVQTFKIEVNGFLPEIAKKIISNNE